MHRTLGKSYVHFDSGNSAGLSDRAYLGPRTYQNARSIDYELNIETARTTRMRNRSFIWILLFVTKIQSFEGFISWFVKNSILQFLFLPFYFGSKRKRVQPEGSLTLDVTVLTMTMTKPLSETAPT
jgi:hypothetical protein